MNETTALNYDKIALMLRAAGYTSQDYFSIVRLFGYDQEAATAICFRLYCQELGFFKSLT